MNSFVVLLIVSSYVTAGRIADRKADIKCVDDGNNALEGLNDQQLYDLTQENLKIGQQMVTKRVKAAADDGFPCYQEFYNLYVGGLVDVLQTGEKERLDKAKTPEEKSDATKAFASITQAMICDEKWRAENLDQLVKDAKCSYPLENFLIQDAAFKPKLLALKGLLTTGQFGLKLKNNVISGVVGEVNGIFDKAYKAGEQCAREQKTPQDRCNNMKILNQELNRLYTLFAIQIESKIFPEPK